MLRVKRQSALMSKITNDVRLKPVWHRMLYSCTHMATVGVKGLIKDDGIDYASDDNNDEYRLQLVLCFYRHTVPAQRRNTGFHANLSLALSPSV